MSARTLTDEQTAALEAGQPVVFVTAAAGSGKTSLLVSRYLRALLEDGLLPEALPTVTFTRRAAGELRERIRTELLVRGRDDLAWSLESAPIGTIDSLCSSLLRRHAVEAGVDPNFQVLDEERAGILMGEALREAWEGAVEEATGDELALLACHQKETRRGLLPLYADLRRIGCREPRFPLDVGDWKAAGDRLLLALDGARIAAAAPRVSALVLTNAEKATQCREWLQSAVPSWEDIEAAAGFRLDMRVGPE